MTLVAALQNVFPPPRRPLRLAGGIPLLGFLVVFIGGCLLLEWADRIVFTWPWAFAVLLVTPWLWWMHIAGYSGLAGWRSVGSLIIRLCASTRS